MNRVEQMKKIQTEALELFTKKNIDYGDAFAKYGVIGVLMRIEDKLQRSMSITKNGVNLINDEGIRDTLIVRYSINDLALMIMNILGGPTHAARYARDARLSFQRDTIAHYLREQGYE
jgi:hypothetical protein